MGQINLSIENPWLKIVKDDCIIAECDKNAFPNNQSAAQYAEVVNNKKKSKIELTFSCLPDPFCGNPQSKVYCLNINPGKPDPCFSDEEAYKDATIKNLRLEQDSCFWAENIKNKCGKSHDGIEWLKRRTMQLKKILDRHPNIFFIEYFPYHSSKRFNFPKHLPSYDFSDALIKEAMKDGKLIIIMREKKGWLDRIDGLKDYKNLYCLKYPQGGYLTPQNIVAFNHTGSENTISVNVIKEYF